ncbi:hypothetical protein G7B40_028615 [Aetokthonos hydrillicola Thurmond2011]|uniref:RNA polymerase sigma factor 70 region 4 type 2 domain-containing protein n=1 Tax=Aetokthonos hydrillicola Thurmond2011 TaxID=2712845 RepID=A0AAP5M7T3_9CYAN|nr:hypothetical protein [Aetokthonos hydrillicola]MBO3461996.1 hypothetical protein [Aetokthonos hydrillicola CCALA 1050]MBW4584301.1 hypothetical protein [Aetokthonos hydrillicola CCALA 1050]MDR9898491.1 hypothetical protein [Aetokthonos hydrillicola Thurmond2011]
MISATGIKVMLNRRSLREKFITFIDTNKSNSIYNPIWIHDSRLERNYARNLDFLEGDSETSLVNHLVELAKREGINSMAYRHLAAYLEEAITWPFKTQYQKFCSDYSCSTHPIYSWQDCVHEARCITAAQNLQKILDKFNQKKSSLRTFVAKKISDKIFRFLRIGVERAKYSNAALLRKTSNSSLKYSLQQLGINDVYPIELSLSCFNDIYVPIRSDSNTRRLEWPNRDKLTEIAKLYEQKYRQYIQSSNYTISVEEFEELLNTCVKALRQDISREIFSHIHVNKNYINKEGEEVNFIDNLPDEDSDPRDRILKQERNEQITSIVIDYYRKLPQRAQNILLVKLGLSIPSQTDIGYVLDIDQPTVSKDLKKAKGAILKEVAEKIKPNSTEFGFSDSKSLTPEDIENIAAIVHDCLEPYLTSHFSGMLSTYYILLPKMLMFYKYLIFNI